MKFKNFVIFLTLSLLIFGCNDLKNRYDPVEASRNIFQMKEFVFYSSENSPPLDIDAWGKIDNENYTVTVPFPPSESLTAAPLTARFWVENVGLDGGGDFELSLNQYWNDSPTIKLDPKEFGYEYYEEPLYETEYDIIMEPKFTVELSYGSNRHFKAGSLSFNMMFNDQAEPDHLGNSIFISGFGSGSTNNFMPIGDGNFSPNLSTAATNQSQNYVVSMTPFIEGPITIQLSADSVQESVSYKGNDESNKLTYYYDTTSPTTGNITVSGLDVSPTTTPAETVLTLYFPPASDNFTDSGDLYYVIYSSITSGSLTNPLISSIGYPSDLTFTYDEMDGGLQGQLTNGTNIYFNVVVTDMATNESQYLEGSQTYTGM